MVEAILAQTPTINRWYANLVVRIRRFLNPLPSVGESTYFYVEERHWDEARLKCLTGSRSSHCVLAQAIAERFKLPWVSVGADGDVSAAEDVLHKRDGYYTFSVDEEGVDVITAFDYLPVGLESTEVKKPTLWPIAVTITRMENNDD